MLTPQQRSSRQVMNVLDDHAAGTSQGHLEQYAVTDNGLLEGIPGHMFDWAQWDQFFARFSLAPEMQAMVQAQQQQGQSQGMQGDK